HAHVLLILQPLQRTESSVDLFHAVDSVSVYLQNIHHGVSTLKNRTRLSPPSVCVYYFRRQPGQSRFGQILQVWPLVECRNILVHIEFLPPGGQQIHSAVFQAASFQSLWQVSRIEV